MPSSPSTFRRASLAAPVLIAAVLVAGCGDKKADAQQPGQAGAGAPPPPEVSVVTIETRRVALTNELPGRVEASRVAEVRARVPGIVQKRVFTEGADVKAGEVLYRIDPSPLQAVLASAQASLARAEANLSQANLQVQRFKPLVEQNAISRQEFDNALTAQKQAQADVAAARASRQTASLNLGYATVNAPIGGRIGRAQVTEGALVGQGEATPLATIQQIDPVYVNMTQSSAELLNLRRALAEGRLERAGKDQAKVTLVTEDGQVYPEAGTLLFSDVAVDESTGAITLRATFPNKNRALLPGMYVRARLDQAVKEAAITVPQQALQRTADGASVMVVGSDGKVVARPVTVDAAQGNSWILSSGLKAGEQVIVEGMQKVKPGATVKALAWKGPTGAVAANGNNGGNNAASGSSGNGANVAAAANGAAATTSAPAGTTSSAAGNASAAASPGNAQAATATPSGAATQPATLTGNRPAPAAPSTSASGPASNAR